MILKYIKVIYTVIPAMSVLKLFENLFFNRGFNFSFWLRLASSKLYGQSWLILFIIIKSTTALIFIPRLKLAAACLLGMAGRWSSIRQP